MTFGDLVAALLGWLGEFVTWALSFVPRYRIIRCDQLGVRKVAGKMATAVVPGVHWYWPWCTEIEALWVQRQSILVPPVPAETCDRIPMEVGCAVVYRIVDPVQYRVENFDADENIGEVARAGLKEIVNEHTFDQLQSPAQEGSRFGDKLARRMGASLKVFGVDVIECRPTHQVRLNRTFRIFSDAREATN